MELKGKKLGILVGGPPGQPGFRHALGLARAGLNRGVDVYAYFIDEAVEGVPMPEVQELRAKGLKLYACAYGANRRNLPMSDNAIYAGLTVVSDLIGGTDRFLCFN